ncbi:hypothetical protein K435DRAFT_780608 [Dendrothele bispora CBS 962.96]|uniref:Uncharacterized protein n=1 Tax=Dendrothele bispora (strain CBS 962.96) TaxID=1314807 RepID=A0A4S8LQL4_DENBC|nr:hypothetical protein K435DRAFT_780608 [Dendrothele bispora CBS 962.96]
MPEGTSLNDIAFDTTAIISLAFEWGLYGISVLMYGATLREVVFSPGKVNHKMVALATAFFVLSTAHAIVDLIRLNEGLVNERNTFPGGPEVFFADATQLYFLIRSGFYLTQTLLADAVVVYRCYVVWQSKWAIVFPSCLWISLLATSIGALYSLGRAVTEHGGVQIFFLAKWINAFFAMSLSTNLISTGILAFKIWSVNKRSAQYRVSTGLLGPVFRVVIDSGILYSVTLTVTLITFVSRSNSQYICLDMLMPIIAISFYMIILRISMAKRNMSSLRHSAMGSVTPSTHRSRATDYNLRPVHISHAQLRQDGSGGTKEGTGSPPPLKLEQIQDNRLSISESSTQWSGPQAV